MARTTRGSKEPFSFHCVICYEFLSPTLNPPVVLPCGHTYVCEHCAKRLDKCMECREPLTKSVPKPVLVPQIPATAEMGWRDIQRLRQQQNRRVLRGHFVENTTPYTPTNLDVQPLEMKQLQGANTSIQLPTPKNLVLLSLIESAMNGHDEEIGMNDGYESGDDDQYVRESMGILGSTCGTYAVRAEEGLIVYDRNPNQDNASAKTNREPAEIRRLENGQTVQIVSLMNGVATVARSAGYIPFDNSSQLVKVGEPKDKSCILQTAYKRISDKRLALEKELRQVSLVKGRLAQKVLEALDDPENDDPFGPVPTPVRNPPSPPSKLHTNAGAVATKDPMAAAPPTLDVPSSEEEHLGSSMEAPESRLSPAPFLNPYPILATQSLDEYRDMIPDDDMSLRSVQSTGMLDDARARFKDLQAEHEDNCMFVAFGCGEMMPLSFLGNLAFRATRRPRRLFGVESDVGNSNEEPEVSSSSAPPSPPPPQPVTTSPSFGGSLSTSSVRRSLSQDTNDRSHPPIDWATGYSGLTLVPKSKKSVGTPNRQVRMMGEHRGVAHIGPLKPIHSAAAW